MTPTRIANVANGATHHPVTGKFLPGNKGGPGNPQAAKVMAFRKALLDAVTPADIRAAVRALVRECRAGNVLAIKELFDRAIGKPVEMDFMERLDRLESFLTQKGSRHVRKV